MLKSNLPLFSIIQSNVSSLIFLKKSLRLFSYGNFLFISEMEEILHKCEILISLKYVDFYQILYKTN